MRPFLLSLAILLIKTSSCMRVSNGLLWPLKNKTDMRDCVYNREIEKLQNYLES